MPQHRPTRDAPVPTARDATAHDAAASALLSISRLWRAAIGRQLAPRGLGDAAWRALWHLRALGGTPVQARLAERMGIERPTLARLLDRMERDGLIRRIPDADDRRANRIAVTAAGHALMRPVASAITSVRARALSGFDAGELAKLAELLGRIEAALAVDDDAPKPHRARAARPTHPADADRPRPSRR